VVSGGGDTPRTSRGLALSFVVVTFLSFPHPVAGIVLDLGGLLAWFSPALLLLCISERSPGAAFRHAFLLSWLASSAILHWIYVVTVTYGHAPAIVGVAAPGLLALYIAPFAACFAWLYRLLELRGCGGALSAALLWTALDHLRSFFLTGFPWATLGYAQHENPGLLPLASLGGVYALSFVTVLGGAALADAWNARREGRAPSSGTRLALLAVVLLHAVGFLLGGDPAASGERVRIAVAQGNIDQGVKWDADWMERTLAVYEDLTRQAASQGAALVVWPETAVPGTLELDAGLATRLGELARTEGVALIVGGVGIEVDMGTRSRAFYDSGFVFDVDGRLRDRYDKTHLVPFGEFVPFRALLGRFFGAVARGIASTDVSRGEAPRALEVALADGRRVRVGVPVCFELLFPDLVRRFVLDGGGVLLGITNDAWYGRTGAPHQFLAITALRSAETGVWTARAANTGVSGFIDGAGKVLDQTPIFEVSFRVQDVPLHPDPAGATFYVRHGDAFAYACWLACLLLMGRAFTRRMGNPPGAHGG
jgi:apolipoprotein N-acyltransferase